ncbi:MAG: N-acetylmuramoyl-L-alanine amidase [Prevotella sp.]|nr:N-acetylmuramoyl-L-alanine amidase [Prevotella sp.]
MKKGNQKRLYILGGAALLGIVAIVYALNIMKGTEEENTEEVKKEYRVIPYPTQNYDREKVNEVRGVILHHTALPTIERSLEVLTLPENKVSSHCLIDTDGTRYILCEPRVVAFHAGRSILNGREQCNEFTIGVEFQGNTVETPLTDDQINSAIEYLLPILDEYKIPLDSIVTHEKVRLDFMAKYPEKTWIKDKCDITPVEYERVMKALRKAKAFRDAKVPQ